MNHVPKNLCETHALGPGTREWLVGVRQVPSFANSHTRVVGYTEARRGYEFVRLNPAFSQVLACTDGEGEVLIDGGWQRCPAGFAYVTAPYAACAYHVRPGRRWQVCWAIYEASRTLPTLEPRTAPRMLRVEATGLHLAIEGLCGEAASVADPAILEFWAALVHSQVLRILHEGGGEPRLARLWASVRRELGEEWNLTRMARTAGVSQESLRRICQQQVGRPPLAHLTHLRMQFAADLLACTDEKIASIASRAGYSDAFAFSNAFKRELGQPPSRYRRAANGPKP